MKLSLASLVCLFTLVTLSNCGDENGKQDNFDRSLILANISTNLIIPGYSNFSDKVDVLSDAVVAFNNDPSLETLIHTRDAWFQAKKSWARSEVFNFGPVDDLAIENPIDLWPTSATGIENAINAYDQTADYLDHVGSNKKGLPAIEYLLFHDSDENVLNEFGSANRQAYLSLLVEELSIHIHDLQNAWMEYKTVFDNNVRNDANASITLLANELIILTEKIKNFKIAVPLGLTTLSDPLPDQVESLYAKKSLEFIDENLDVIEEVFTGKSGQGFDDYLNQLKIDGTGGIPLSSIILQQIDKCKASLEDISVPLQYAVNDQGAKVEQLFIDLQQLTVYLKTDMMSRLGLLVIFSDNDGD